MADTTIGQNITIDGEVTGDDPVFVEGTVKGRIALSNKVTVTGDGLVEADIESDEVEVNGQLNGNIAGRDRVEITTDGRMVGDITAPRIHIADGASFKGHIDMSVEE